MRAYGIYLPWMLLLFARSRDVAMLKGYLSYRGPPKDPALRGWMRLYQKQRIRLGLGLGSWMFRDDPDGRGTFVLPRPTFSR